MASVILWWLVTVAIGLAAFPLAARVCRDWPDRGYSAAKAAGVLIVTYLVWLLPSLRLAPFGIGLIAIALGVLMALGWLVAGGGGGPSRRGLARRAMVSEAIFAAAYGFFVWVLWQRPDIFSAQLEDFANFGFLQSIHRSVYFPPEDPWFAGRSLPYYYGGHLIAAWMGRLTSVAPEISFNLASATFYALTVSMAFGLGYRLTGRAGYGFLAALFVAFMGYITGVLQLITWLFQINLFGLAPDRAGDLVEWLTSFKWWWTIRIIPDTVTFYPYYILSNADLHPMATSIPFQLLVVALALAFTGERSSRVDSVVCHGLLSLALGFFILLNSWAYPVFLLFLLVVSLFFRLRIPRLLMITGLSLVLYLPFLVSRAVQGFHGAGIVPERTPLYAYLGIAGVFWFILFVLLFAFPQARWKRAALAVAAVLPGVAVAWLWGFEIAVVLLPALALALPLGWAKDLNGTERFVLVLVLMGIALAAGADVFYLRDSYGPPFERYNTVMKAYLMQWLFLGLASAGAVFLVQKYVRGKVRFAVLGIALLGVMASLVHPVASTASWTSGKAEALGPGRGTLDGLAYLRQLDPGDYGAVRWLNENVSGSQVILEAPSETEIAVYNARVSSLTGLPGLLGWGPWEVQWGRGWDEVYERARDIAVVYNSEKPEEALGVIGRYHVKYIYIGALERGAYDSSGLAKFSEAKEYFEEVYDADGVQIYRVKQR
ncbi:MAG: hypothetical protein HY673_20825 [Chloroflexi bacterium]|nr:hypothetical protein [Chloroflexota bacterium]